MPTPTTPLITDLRVIPVAGRDSMLLNLSGAHGPFFTRNLAVLTDSAGHTQPLHGAETWNQGGYAVNAVQRVAVRVT